MDDVLPEGPFSRSCSDRSAGESAEKFGNIENFSMFQHCPSVCTVCHFFNDLDVRGRSYSYLTLTEPAKNSEVCQKLTRLLDVQSAWTEKESSIMSNSPSSATNLQPRLNSDRAIHPAISLDINPDKIAINPDKIAINDIADRHSRPQTQTTAQAPTDKSLKEQIYAISDQLVDIKYLYRKEIDALKVQIANIDALYQEALLDRRQRYEADLRQAYQQRYQAAIAALTSPNPKAIPEPRTQPTTYQVPSDRTASSKLSQILSVAPFFLSMMGLGIVLAFSVVLAYPSEAVLGSFVKVMTEIVPVLFLLGIFSLVIGSILEINR